MENRGERGGQRKGWSVYLGIALGRRLVDSRCLVLLLLDLYVLVVHLPEQGIQLLLVPPVPVEHQDHRRNDQQKPSGYSADDLSRVS